jgi:hypothetical protein
MQNAIILKVLESMFFYNNHDGTWQVDDAEQGLTYVYHFDSNKITVYSNGVEIENNMELSRFVRRYYDSDS